MFTFAPGQFSPDDLLLNQRLPATLPPSGFGATTATLNGSAHSFGLPTTAWFEWGTNTNLGNVTDPQELGGDFTTTNLSQVLTGLSLDVTYYFHVVASNKLGVFSGADQSFSLNPSVATLYPSGLSATAASLNGVANPKGASLSGWFEWGLTTNYGNLTTPQVLGNGNTDTNFSAVVTNLFPGGTFQLSRRCLRRGDRPGRHERDFCDAQCRIRSGYSGHGECHHSTARGGGGWRAVGAGWRPGSAARDSGNSGYAGAPHGEF